MIGKGGSGSNSEHLMVNGIEAGFAMESLGLGIVTMNVSGSGCGIMQYFFKNPYSSADDATAVSAFLNGLPEGTILAGVSSNDLGSTSRVDLMRSAFMNIGIDLTDYSQRSILGFITKKGDPSYAKYQLLVQDDVKLHFIHYLKQFPKRKSSYDH